MTAMDWVIGLLWAASIAAVAAWPRLRALAARMRRPRQPRRRHLRLFLRWQEPYQTVLSEATATVHGPLTGATLAQVKQDLKAREQAVKEPVIMGAIELDEE